MNNLSSFFPGPSWPVARSNGKAVPAGAEHLSVSDCRSHLLRILKEEIERLVIVNRGLEEVEQGHLEATMWATFVPPQDTCDRLLRYETTIDREFYRAAHELERVQRIRQGLSVPSPLAVDVEVNEHRS